MSNLFKRFSRLFPKPPLRVGTVDSVDGTNVYVTESGGGTVVLRGEGFTTGDKVYFKDGAIEGPAPSLTFVTVEE